jgi:hypothetical protein
MDIRDTVGRPELDYARRHAARMRPGQTISAMRFGGRANEEEEEEGEGETGVGRLTTFLAIGLVTAVVLGVFAYKNRS